MHQEQHDETGGGPGEAPGKTFLYILLDVVHIPETVMEGTFDNQVAGLPTVKSSGTVANGAGTVQESPGYCRPSRQHTQRNRILKRPRKYTVKEKERDRMWVYLSIIRHCSWRYLRKPHEVLRKPPATSDTR